MRYWAKNNRSTYTTQVSEEQKKAIEEDSSMDFSFEPIPEPKQPLKPVIEPPEEKPKTKTTRKAKPKEEK